MYSVEVFGHNLNLKDKACSINGHQDTVDPYVNLYVRLTNVCNAKCPFCTFHGNDTNKFDRLMLCDVKKKKHDSGIRINKVSFTGGEPTTNMDDLSFCLREVKDLDPNIFTVLSTNGYAVKDLGSDRTLIDSIALSRHHYDDRINASLFGGVATDLPVLSDDVHITCNLIKGRIDSKEECHRFITEMGKKGFTDIGFVSLMGVNEFCRDSRVDFSDINLGDMPDTIQSTKINNGHSCKCANYLTSLDDGTIVKSYSRYVYDTKSCNATDNTLVFDLDELKVGFNGKVIYR
jgi:molybdenum cofactor biosynthesis enzyme MoaA